MNQYCKNLFAPFLISITILSIYLPIKLSGFLFVPSLFISLRSGCFHEIDSRLKYLFLFFMIFFAFFTFISSDLRASIKGFYDILRGFAFFFIALVFAKKINDIKVLIFVKIFALFLIVGNLFFLQPGGFYGYHENPNVTAFMLVFLLSFVFPFASFSSEKEQNGFYFLWPGVVLCLYLIFLTQCRGAVFGILGAMLVCLCLWKKTAYKYNEIAVGIIFCFVVTFLFVIFNKKIGLSGREEIWVSLINSTMSDKFLFGYGINNVKNVIEGKELFGIIAHNIFIEVFVCTGLVGFLFFLGIVFLTIKHFLKFEYLKNAKFFLGVFGFSAFILIGSFDLKFFSFRFLAIIFFFIGIIYSQRISEVNVLDDSEIKKIL